jgi:hypothetical protein|tara:strand:+ start:98 stop:496 length:399 start_codon:yes stop_codon:yes gene_type:complete
MIKYHAVGSTGRKMVEKLPNNVALTLEENSINCNKYNDGKVAISITVNGKNNGGYTYDQNLKDELPIDVIQQVEFLGGRVTTKEILYGNKFVPKQAKLSKYADMKALAQIISSSLNKSESYTFDDACKDGLL